MNDFTKEELYDLQSWGDAYTSFDLDSDAYKMFQPLLNKIQSMIDNYCIHEKRVATSDENGHMLVQCSQCNFVFLA